MYKETLSLTINHSRCVNCGDCIHECPNDVLEYDAKLYPCVKAGGEDRCIHCQHCLMICPAGALSIDGINPDHCAPVSEIPAYRQMLNLVKSRRSVRNYKQKNVDPAIIADLMDAMRFSPTGVNHHKLHFALIDDLAVMQKFRRKLYEIVRKELEQNGTHPNYVRFMPMLAAIKNGRDPIFRSAPHMILVSSPIDAPCAAVDPIIALSYFELLANARGLSTLWCGRFMNVMNAMAPELYSLFSIPDAYKASYAMMFGTSSVSYARTGQPEAVALSRVKL